MPSHDEMKTALLGFLLVLLTGLCLLTAVTPAEAAPSKRLQPPGSFLGPEGNSPVFVGGFLQGGRAFAYDTIHGGYGGMFLFRPGAAADFLPFLYRWNCGAVGQIEKQRLGPGMDLLSADGIIRHYVEDMRDPEATGSPFVGIGVGATRVNPPDGYSGPVKYWSLLFEAGREWTVQEQYLVWVRTQYRYYDYSGLDYRNLTLQVGVGLPWPF